MLFSNCVVGFQGLDDEYQEEGKLLGSYTYQEDGDALQTYPVTVSTLNTASTGLIGQM